MCLQHKSKKLWCISDLFTLVSYLMLFDAHTHLNSEQLFPDRKNHLEDFCTAWWKGLVNIGVDAIYNQRAIDIATQREDQDKCLVKAAIGYHPCIVDEQWLQKSDISKIVWNLKSVVWSHESSVVAIGEIGVDLYRWESIQTKILQQELFDQQCHLATKFNLPIVIHSRAAFAETMEILDNHPSLDIYFHCRGYTPRELDKLSTFSWHCWTGFCGNISYPKAQELRDSLVHITTNYKPQIIKTSDGLESTVWGLKLLLETDAPYLAIQAERGQMQTPAKIGLLYDYVAGLLGMDEMILQQGIEKNFKNLYIR